MEKQRLDKFISNQMNIARSEARKVIRRGKVSVDADIVRDPSTIVDVCSCEISYEGNIIGYKKYIYIMMNKPSGVLSAASDKSRQTVVDLVPDDMRRAGLFPVGRLDKDTTGLLLITDDGEFAHNCISPKKGISKIYEAELDGDITPDMPPKFLEGIVLADGTVCKSAELERVAPSKARIKITEGKYHQIKRMFGTVGLGVNKLHRISIGELTLPENLGSGECVEISSEKLKKCLKSAF